MEVYYNIDDSPNKGGFEESRPRFRRKKKKRGENCRELSRLSKR